MTVMSTRISFDYQKATQAINYFIRKSANLRENKMLILKLIWVADRYHLRKYGRPIIGDEYIAMGYGPVASGVKDIAESDNFLSEQERTYSDEFISLVGKHTLVSQKEVDLEVFSDTDVEGLEFAYREFGSSSKFAMVEVTHQYPEWKKYKTLLESGQITRATMSYLDFFDNPDQLAKDKFEMDPQIIAESKEAYLENVQLQAVI